MSTITTVSERKQVDAHLRSFFAKWAHDDLEVDLTFDSVDDEELFRMVDHFSQREVSHER
jgi:hypothetical protein